MVLVHVADSWTRDADRDRAVFHWTMFAGGVAGAAFLFMAGVGTALSGDARVRGGASRAAALLALARRGAVIFGLAFVFRAQALFLGWGAPVTFLTVDILNVMGLALVTAALLWGAASTTTGRVLAAGAATLAVAMIAPIVWTAAWVDALPAPLQWYWRPTRGHSNFTLVPWSAFVFAGVGTGAALAAARHADAERRLQFVLAGVAVAVGVTAWWASYQPSIYPPGRATFWGASPAFFFLRLAIVMALLPLAWSLRRVLPGAIASPLATLGAASLFAYWVHVELVYGGIAIPLKRRIPFELCLIAALAIAVGLARLAPRTRRWVAARDAPPVRLKRLVARLL